MNAVELKDMYPNLWRYVEFQVSCEMRKNYSPGTFSKKHIEVLSANAALIAAEAHHRTLTKKT